MFKYIKKFSRTLLSFSLFFEGLGERDSALRWGNTRVSALRLGSEPGFPAEPLQRICPSCHRQRSQGWVDVLVLWAVAWIESENPEAQLSAALLRPIPSGRLPTEIIIQTDHTQARLHF